MVPRPAPRTGHLAAPVQSIPVLAVHPNTEVRALVAARADCPPGILADLTADRMPEVAGLALLNQSCPSAARVRAATHSDPVVAHTARWLLTDPMPPLPWLPPADHPALHGRPPEIYYADHPKCPAHILAELSQHHETYARTRVARHRACPPDIMRRLAQDPEWEVRMYLATNPACPTELLEILTDDQDSAVHRTAQNALHQHDTPFS